MGFRLNRITLLFTVFGCSFVGMAIEMVGSRVLSPYYGNTIFVWTGLIGIVLGGMSLGYWLGGSLTDRKWFKEVEVGKILRLAAFTLLSTALLKDYLLQFVDKVCNGQIFGSIISILFLFFPISVLLGIVFTYLLKVFLTRYGGSTGVWIGRLYAISTLGSVFGVFCTGYWLIPVLGNKDLLILLSGFLFFLSFFFRINPFYLLIPGLIFVLHTLLLGDKVSGILFDTDSYYNRIIVKTDRSAKGERLVFLSTDGAGFQSGINLDKPNKLIFDYIDAFRIVSLFHPKIDRALMLGGGGFTFPRYFIENDLGNSIDVVEIDKKVVDVAKKYFMLGDNQKINIIVDDARNYLKKSSNKYDIVFFDAYGPNGPPHYLITLEHFRNIREKLGVRGLFTMNLVSAIEGKNSLMLMYSLNTLRRVFPAVDVFAIQDKGRDEIQNLILVAYMTKEGQINKTNNPLVGDFLSRKLIIDTSEVNKIFTDDWSPIEYLTADY